MRHIRELFKNDDALATIGCGLAGTPLGLLGICCGPLNLCFCCLPMIIPAFIGGGIGAVVGCMTDTIVTVCSPILALCGSAAGGSTGMSTVQAIRI